ncbi:hypothetical protein ACIBQ5_37805 [Streptomyces massasporeus]|uniref:hypothetical protein n=1 Tax=Streptomyces massasporeus TaxID=67324 RepID=UPI00378D6D4D
MITHPPGGVGLSAGSPRTGTWPTGQVIRAKGEFEAVQTLADVAEPIAGHPATMHQRILSTMAGISSEPHSTPFYSLPMEILPVIDNLRGSEAAPCPCLRARTAVRSATESAFPEHR